MINVTAMTTQSIRKSELTAGALRNAEGDCTIVSAAKADPNPLSVVNKSWKRSE
jgi:hypothetical protein